MVNSISDIIIAVILGITILFAIVVFCWIFFVLRKQHIPKTPLSEEQKKNLVEYGLLHFTDKSGVKGIRDSEWTIKPFAKNATFGAEKNKTWFFPANDYPEKAIRQISSQAHEIRPDKDYCLSVQEISADEVDGFLYVPHKGYIAHEGPLQKPIVVYHLVEGKWRIDASFNKPNS